MNPLLLAITPTACEIRDSFSQSCGIDLRPQKDRRAENSSEKKKWRSDHVI
jgi:hypothetical protein